MVPDGTQPGQTRRVPLPPTFNTCGVRSFEDLIVSIRGYRPPCLESLHCRRGTQVRHSFFLFLLFRPSLSFLLPLFPAQRKIVLPVSFAVDAMVANYDGGIMEHWNFFAAMTLVSASTFQYGLDFGAINGLQAMVPFLQAS